MSRNIIMRATDLHVQIGASHILRGIDFEVGEGEVVALLGANGSGKSTLVRTLTGIVPATRGSVTLFDEPLSASVPWQRLGYVPQRVAAATGMGSTAGEIVSSGLLYGGRLRLPRGHRQLARQALGQVGLEQRFDTTMAHLSGGQQQRVLIARALVRKPDLLVLDEPVAGVDRPSQVAFAQTLERLVADGKTIVVVLHELGEFEPLITRTVVLRHGKIVHDGAALRAADHHAHDDHEHVHPHEGFTPEGSPLIAETGFES
ncbi:metal ABC transporter ATP-binding protein [Populibacterium corticicola]|jgi:zinc transport system ATP-binding protein|uniref:Metal ABC transporter ATP-binding protein n=1 Tax=Populibacterium corticicola TaxID=1812826 RepID=A0ABW5XA31_9MICO